MRSSTSSADVTPVEQHAEVVAAEPGDDLAAAPGAVEAGGDLHHHRVAEHVSERFVDLAKMIEVDDGDRARDALGDQLATPTRGNSTASASRQQIVIDLIANLGELPGVVQAAGEKRCQHVDEGEVVVGERLVGHRFEGREREHVARVRDEERGPDDAVPVAAVVAFLAQLRTDFAAVVVERDGLAGGDDVGREDGLEFDARVASDRALQCRARSEGLRRQLDDQIFVDVDAAQRAVEAMARP